MVLSLSNATITDVDLAGAADAASGLLPMSTLLRRAAESLRQGVTQDAKFYKSLLYYFELRVPKGVSPGPAKYLYPLVIPPEAYRMSEPFAVEKTFTNGGGLFVEEQGIVAREITISGNTGWAPRRVRGPVSAASNIATPKNRTWSRDTTKTVKALSALSGQRHFQFLQDTVFRTYADLKQDPSTSEDTVLIFHNVRDDEHWRVIPLEFTTDRNSGNPLVYNYSISMLAVDAVTGAEVKFSEDRNVIDALRDAFRVMTAAVDLIRASVQELSGVTGELRALNGGFVTLLDGAIGIADATAAFLDGTATLIALPFTSVEAAIRNGELALEAVEEAILADAIAAVRIPGSVLHSIRLVQDGLAMIGTYPEHFRNSVQAEVDKFQRQQSLAQSHSQVALQTASASVPQSLRAYSTDVRGTAPMPGDYARSQSSLGLGLSVPRYASAVEYVLEQGDTLVNLAARFLNDARNWKFIAIFNGLQAPYISEEGLPGTLSRGDRILIPSTSTPPLVQANPATLGARANDPGAVQALGSDIIISPVGRDRFDLQIDVGGGSTDVVLTSGIPNLQQAMRTRVITERGTDVLYRNLGCARVIGLGVTEVDLESAKISLADAVQADPRIASISGISFVLEQPDAVLADVTAEVRGFTRPEQVVVVTPIL